MSAAPGHRATDAPPSAAVWLGAAGALPFIGLAAGVLVFDPDSAAFLRQGLAFYGAAILSFMGGIRWGLAMPDRPDLARLGISVVWPLIAWPALMLGDRMASLVMALAFVALLLMDVRLTARGEAPAWYPRLRKPLTAAATLSLLVGALA